MQKDDWLLDMKFSYISRAILFGMLYVGLFTLSRVFLATYFQYLQHIISLLLAFVLALFYFHKRKALIIEYLAVLIVLLLYFNVLTTLSMNIDRSRSVEVIVLVQEAEKREISLQEVLEDRAISDSEVDSYVQRFNEQSQMKLISGDSQHPKLTFLGRIFLNIAGHLASIWNLDGFRITRSKD